MKFSLFISCFVSIGSFAQGIRPAQVESIQARCRSIQEVDLQNVPIYGSGYVTDDRKEGLGITCFKTRGDVCNTIQFVYFNFATQQAYRLPDCFSIVVSQNEKLLNDESRFAAGAKNILAKIDQHLRQGVNKSAFVYRQGWNWSSEPQVLSRKKLSTFVYSMTGNEHLSEAVAIRKNAATPEDIQLMEKMNRPYVKKMYQ